MPTLIVQLVLHAIALTLVSLSSPSAAAPTGSKSDPSYCLQSESSYDFIIIGGGTAGLTLASRLSRQLPSCSLLVIEAGPDARSFPGIYIPGLRGSTLGGAYDFNYTTIPQKFANDRRWPANRGRVLGGSSALNLMVWDRGAKAEYDSWESFGNPGWNWDGMIRAMEKAETYTQSVAADGYVYNTGIDGGVGYGGPIQFTINEYVPVHQQAWDPTMQGLGFQQNLDPLNGDNLGVSWQPSSLSKATHTRSYSTEYLGVAGPNMCVETNTTVVKVVFDESKDSSGLLVVSGVVLADGTTISARKEVILSAGTFDSPALLERSGHGPKGVLEDAGITQLVDVPGVGENLQDHVRVTHAYQLKPGIVGFDQVRINKTYAAEQRALYDAGKRSTYWYTGSAYAFGTWDQAAADNKNALLSLAKPVAANDPSHSVITEKKLQFLDGPCSNSVPQIEVIFSDGYTGTKGYPSNSSSLYGVSLFTLISGVQHPLSHGTVHINASDPQGKPLIDPRYLSNEYDVQAAISLAKFNRKIALSEPLRDYWVAEYEPGLNVTTDEQFREFVKNSTATFYHPAGTCSMHPRKHGGVVDPSLKVYGTANLRVVDASIMPLLVSGHIQTAVYGIAERAGEIIASEWTT